MLTSGLYLWPYPSLWYSEKKKYSPSKAGPYCIVQFSTDIPDLALNVYVCVENYFKQQGENTQAKECNIHYF